MRGGYGTRGGHVTRGAPVRKSPRVQVNAAGGSSQPVASNPLTTATVSPTLQEHPLTPQESSPLLDSPLLAEQPIRSTPHISQDSRTPLGASPTALSQNINNTAPLIPQVIGSSPGGFQPTPSQNNTSPLIPPVSGSPTGASPPTPSQNNEGDSSAAATFRLDTRALLIQVKSKSFEPPDVALNNIMHVVYSHFDGPYISWGRVPGTTVDLWWKMFKKRCRWDEARYSELFVRKAFNHVGGKHLRGILQKAHHKMKKPMWIKQEIWEEMLVIWEKDDAYKRQSEAGKRNRAVAIEKGIPPYRGGSVSVTVHKRKLTDLLGKVPSPKETYERCHKKKNGTWSTAVGPEIVEKFDVLVEQATQKAHETEQPLLVDENELWIEAAGVHKGRVVGMGSESDNMLQMTRSSHNATPHVASEPYEAGSLRMEVKEEITTIQSQLMQGMTDLSEKRAHLGANVEKSQQEIRQEVTNLGGNLQQHQQQVREDLTNLEEHVNNSVEALHEESRLNNNEWGKKLDELMFKIGSFFTSTK